MRNIMFKYEEIYASLKPLFRNEEKNIHSQMDKELREVTNYYERKINIYKLKIYESYLKIMKHVKFNKIGNNSYSFFRPNTTNGNVKLDEQILNYEEKERLLVSIELAKANVKSYYKNKKFI